MGISRSTQTIINEQHAHICINFPIILHLLKRIKDVRHNQEQKHERNKQREKNTLKFVINK